VSVTVSYDPHEEPTIVYETVSGVVHENNFAVVDGKPEALPEGKVVTAPQYVRPRGKATASTKDIRPRPVSKSTEE
jgi:hypothetical protein